MTKPAFRFVLFIKYFQFTIELHLLLEVRLQLIRQRTKNVIGEGDLQNLIRIPSHQFKH